MKEECVIVILARNALLLKKLNVRVHLGEAVTDAVCVNAIRISLVQVVSAVALGVTAVGEANVPAA